jgi:DedD protein
MAEVPDINVDELRRRARRRLIGAIVLALAAAVIVPMLLESEPKPLGEDVSVKIPPEDTGKFVNRLSDKSAKAKTADTPAKTEPAKEPAKPEAAKVEPAKVEPAKVEPAKVEPANVEPAAPAASSPAPPSAPISAAPAPPESAAAPASVTAPRKSVAQAEQKMLAPTGKPAATAAPVPAPVSATVPASAPAPAVSADAAREGFSVQLAAFADDKGANSLVNKLKRAAYPAYTEPLSTSRGTLWRVRVGPYPSRDAAVEVRDRLKGEGYNGIVAAAK